MAPPPASPPPASPRTERFAVWALGTDRPGIVAAVTGALLEGGANLEDCSMTLLADQFAMVVLARAPADRGVAELEGLLAPAAETFDLEVAVRALPDEHRGTGAGAPYVVSVYGADRPGIVHHVTAALAEMAVNVTNLETRVVEGDPDPVYAMVLEVVAPPGVGEVEITAHLGAQAAALGVDVRVHPAGADVL